MLKNMTERKHNCKDGCTEPATGVCECGHRIALWDEYMGACECPHCGRWYNLFGQELNHPDTWRNGDDW